VSFSAAGDITAYDDTRKAAVVSSFASSLGVAASDVSLQVVAASVRFDLSINVEDGGTNAATAARASNITSTLQTKLGTSSAATLALGIPVTASPVLEVNVTNVYVPVPLAPPPAPSPPSSSDDDNKVVIIAAAGGGGGLVAVGVVALLMQRRSSAKVVPYSSSSTTG